MPLYHTVAGSILAVDAIVGTLQPAAGALNRTNYGPADGSIRRPSNEAVGYLRDLFPIIPSAGILIEF